MVTGFHKDGVVKYRFSVRNGPVLVRTALSKASSKTDAYGKDKRGRARGGVDHMVSSIPFLKDRRENGRIC